MVLIPGDGTGLSDSNSYADVTEADDYFATHPFYADNWAALGTPDKERLLIAASASLDSLMNWRGYILNTTQAMGWPRIGVIDDEGRVVSNSIVPLRVKQAMLELAFHLSRGDPYAPSASAGLDSLKIDVIELNFAGSITVTPVPAPTLLLLRGLGDYAYGGRVRKVLVG